MKLGTDWREGLDWQAMYSTLPLSDLDKELELKEETFLDTWLAHPPHDTEFWEPASYQHHYAFMDLPVLNISGWWDGDMPGAIQNFPGMRSQGRDHQFLIMGPWTHFFNSQRSIGQVDFGNEAIVDLDSRIVRFFDRYLKGIENGIENESPVLVFVMGRNEWRAEEDWPLPTTQPTRLLLSSQGNASERVWRWSTHPGGR